MSKIYNFEYDGFFTRRKPTLSNYTVTFKEWTNDPGIAIFSCSDGIDRAIPTCCLVENIELPKQNMDNKILFGNPSTS